MCNDIRSAAKVLGLAYATACKRLKNYKIGVGKWNLTSQQIEKLYEAPSAQPAVEPSYIPEKDDSYIQFGTYTPIKKIVKSKLFYPAFITGLSGNGKTMSVEQVCADLGRELIRVNITIETDEDDLIGGFRLVDGSTVWHNGPVVEALERCSPCYSTRLTLLSNKILCLQSILEGKGVYLKKIGRYVRNLLQVSLSSQLQTLRVKDLMMVVS